MKNFLFLGFILVTTISSAQEISTQTEPKQVQKEQVSKESKIPKRVKIVRPVAVPEKEVKSSDKKQ